MLATEIKHFLGLEFCRAIISVEGLIGVGFSGIPTTTTVPSVFISFYQLGIQSAAMVTRFGYAFFAAALLTAIGIIFAGSLKQERHHEVTVTVTATVDQH